MKSRNPVKAGFAEVDITPPVGVALMGSLRPRKSIGIQDPLYAKALVLESGGSRLAYVLLDICMLARREGDAAVRLAARQTGIPESQIVWAANHTHTGPYTVEFSRCKGAVSRPWLARLPRLFAAAVEQACADIRPVSITRCRAFRNELLHHRRLLFKGGQAINTWNLYRAADAQCIGSAGPVDPEIPVLIFESPDGQVRAAMFQYALHTNTNFGPCFSADYPAVVAARLRERFGPQVVTLFVPGACGNINGCGHSYRQVGDALADSILGAWPRRVPLENPGALGALKRNLSVPLRDPTPDQEPRIRASGWDEDCQDFFRQEWRALRKEKRRTVTTVIQAWRIGEAGFASLPGEMFVEWGLKLKRESPFPWTFPVELGGDYLGYLITADAWEAGGYEALISRVARPSVEGVARMAEEALAMLRELHAKGKRR